MLEKDDKSALTRMLYELVCWLEGSYYKMGPCEPSEFGVELPRKVMALPECALDLALSSDQPVLLASSVFSIESIIASLVLRRAGITLEQIYMSDISEADFDALEASLQAINHSRLWIETPVEQTGSGASEQR